MAKSNKPKSDASAGSGGAVDSNVDPSIGSAVSGDMKGDVTKASVSATKVLENGVSTTEVENPAPGKPGASSPAAVKGGMSGGGSLGSTSYGLNSRGPSTRRSEGKDTGYDRLIERESYMLDDTGSVSLKLEIDAPASIYDKDEFKSPVYASEDLRFTIDNAHLPDTAVLSNPFERPRISELTKHGLIFGRGQTVNYCKESKTDPDIYYPRETMNMAGTTSGRAPVNPGRIGNYLLRAINFHLSDTNQITRVSFDQVAFDCTEDVAGDVSFRQDHRRMRLNIATDKVDDRMRSALYDPNNLDKRLYTPLVDNVPDPISLMMLTSDIAATDGLAAAMALRSYASALSKLKQYRGVFGSGAGTWEQLYDMVCPYVENALDRSSTRILGIDDFKSLSTGLAGGVTSMAYVLSMDSPRKYVTMGDFFTQPRGLLMPFKHALANFDNCQFYADSAALEVIQKLMTKQESDSSDVPIVGYSNMGLIVPYSPNDIFVYNPVSRLLESKYATVEYVTNNSLTQQLGSPFWAGIVETFRIEVLPRLLGLVENGQSWVTKNFVTRDGDSRVISIPLDFSLDHISFFQMLAADAFARIPKLIPKLTGVYQKFVQDYGFDPIIDDTIVRITQSDAFKGSLFSGVSSGFTLSKVTDVMRLMIEDPERLTVEVAPGKSDATHRAGSVMIRGHWAYNTSYEDGDGGADLANVPEPVTEGVSRVRYPAFRKGSTKTKSYELLQSLGPKSYFRTRDLPVRFPIPTGLDKAVDCKVRTINEVTLPVAWLSGMPVIVCEPKSANLPAVDPNTGGHFTGTFTVGDYMKYQRENGRLAPAPASILEYSALTHKSGVEFVSNEDTPIYRFNQDQKLVNKGYLTIRSRPLETYILKGVYQDTGYTSGNFHLDNRFGMMLNRHMYTLHSDADVNDYEMLVNAFGIIPTTDGFDSDNVHTGTGYAFDLTIMNAHEAYDGELTGSNYPHIVGVMSRQFCDLYPMLYFHHFVSSPFYGTKSVSYCTDLKTIGDYDATDVPVKIEDMTRSMLIENSYYEFERMLGCVGLVTVDWDEYMYRVMSEKEAMVDYITDLKYEKTDNLMFAGTVSSTAAGAPAESDSAE